MTTARDFEAITESGPLLRELRETPNERVVGFLDDDPRLRGRRIHGVKVLGPSDATAEAIARTGADAVIVTFGEEQPQRVAEIVRACDASGVSIQFLQRRLTATLETIAEAPVR